MKHPLILSLLSITAAISLVYRLIGVFGALLALRHQALDSQIMGWLFVDTFAALLAAITLWAIHTRPRGAFLFVLLFPLIGFFVYPIQNLLATVGHYPPPPSYEDDQLLGGAAVELSRLGWFFVMFLWLGFSRASRLYLKRENVI